MCLKSGRGQPGSSRLSEAETAVMRAKLKQGQGLRVHGSLGAETDLVDSERPSLRSFTREVYRMIFRYKMLFLCL